MIRNYKEYTIQKFIDHKELFIEYYDSENFLISIAEEIRNNKKVKQLLNSLDNMYFPSFEDIIETALNIESIKNQKKIRNNSYFDMKKDDDYFVITCLRILEDWAYNYLPNQEPNPIFQKSISQNEELGWFTANKIFDDIMIFNIHLQKNSLKQIRIENNLNSETFKGVNYIYSLSEKKQDRLLDLLVELNEIQKMPIGIQEKTERIKKLLWTNQNMKSKLFIGGFLGTIAGLFVFGTGGVGIAGLGGAFGIWGFLAGTSGGVFIASLIENFTKK